MGTRANRKLRTRAHLQELVDYYRDGRDKAEAEVMRLRRELMELIDKPWLRLWITHERERKMIYGEAPEHPDSSRA